MLPVRLIKPRPPPPQLNQHTNAAAELWQAERKKVSSTNDLRWAHVGKRGPCPHDARGRRALPRVPLRFLVQAPLACLHRELSETFKGLAGDCNSTLMRAPLCSTGSVRSAPLPHSEGGPPVGGGASGWGGTCTAFALKSRWCALNRPSSASYPPQ